VTVAWDYGLAVGEPDIATHTGLLLAEDAALKAYVAGLTVPDKDGGSIEVQVWFRSPEGERRQQFPFITLDYLDIEPSYDRWTSIYNLEREREDYGRIYQPSKAPDLPAVPEGSGRVVDPYLMHKLTYQVSTYARSALHDRCLTSFMLTDVFPPRPFWIGVDADATWRRCELMDHQQVDTFETTESGEKRTFRKVYTITMDAEIPQSKVVEVEQATRIHVDLYTDDVTEREPLNHLYDDDHQVAAETVTVVPPPGP
jgi:hypothetical protein